MRPARRQIAMRRVYAVGGTVIGLLVLLTILSQRSLPNPPLSTRPPAASTTDVERTSGTSPPSKQNEADFFRLTRPGVQTSLPAAGEDSSTNTESGSTKRVCERSVTFVLSDRGGFPLQMTALVNAMIYATDTGRAFFLDDRNWNYGRWNDFFEPIPLPPCTLPANPELLYHFPNRGLTPAELRRINIRFQRAPHQLMTQWSWHLLDEHMDNWYYNELATEVMAYEDAFRAQEAMLKQIWRPNMAARTLIDEQIHDTGLPLLMDTTTQGRYLAFQIFRLASINEYVDAAVKYVTENPTAVDHPVMVFITSRKSVAETKDYLTKLKPTWEFVSSFEEDPSYRFNSDGAHNSLASYDAGERIKFGLALITDITLLSRAQSLACTFQAPACRFIAVLKGWSAWRSTAVIGSDEWVPTIYPRTANGTGSANPHQSYWNQPQFKKSSGRNGGRRKIDMLGT